MKDVLIRAGKTLVQVAVSYIIGTLATGIDVTDKTVVFGVIVSAGAAGISAAMNIIINAVNGGNENA